MLPGQAVSVQQEKLLSVHPGIRFDVSQGSAAMFAPRGARGHVARLSDDGMEALVELYWGAAAPGDGNVWKIWVKREWFGQLFVK
jgi:hypothetical protein